MHPDILAEIADARMADRHREAARARRVLAARRAGDSRGQPGGRAWRLGATAALAALRGRARAGGAARPRVPGAR